MKCLLRHRGQRLNLQSRFVFGADNAAISSGDVVRRRSAHAFAAGGASLPKLYRAFGFAQLPGSVNAVCENVAKRRFDADAFHRPQLQKFLADRHQHDLRLYAAVLGASWPADGRHPFRRVLPGQDAVTSEDFDEQVHLRSNPDAVSAVKKARPESTRAHFERQGCAEKRMTHRWVAPPAEASELESGSRASSAPERLRKLRKDRTQIAAASLSGRQALMESAG